MNRDNTTHGREDTRSLIYREPWSPDELIELLRLRYAIYHSSRLAKVALENGTRIDVDSYDLRSLHFGLYDNTTPVGYVRIVTDVEGPWCGTIAPFLDESGGSTDLAPLPLMNYFPDRQALDELYVEFRQSGLRVVEAGRLSLSPEHRSISTAAGLVAATFAVALVHGVDEAIVTCVPAQARFYERFWFRQVPGTGVHFCPEVGVKLVCLNGSRHRVPKEKRELIDWMAGSMVNKGYIALDADVPVRGEPTREVAL